MSICLSNLASTLCNLRIPVNDPLKSTLLSQFMNLLSFRDLPFHFLLATHTHASMRREMSAINTPNPYSSTLNPTSTTMANSYLLSLPCRPYLSILFPHCASPEFAWALRPPPPFPTNIQHQFRFSYALSIQQLPIPQAPGC